MLIGIDPVAVSLGPVVIRWFGLLALLGLATGTWVAWRRAASDERERLLDALVWVLPVATLTARAGHVLGAWDYYFTQPGDIWKITLQGMSLWGGMLGAAIVIVVRLRGDPLRARVFDLAVVGLALGIAIGRVGAFVDGHGQGLPADVAWAAQYTHPLSSTPDFGVWRHPAQVYDGLVALTLFLVLVVLATRRGPPGTIARIFVVAYAAARVALGAVRLDPPFLFGLQVDQLIAMSAIVFVVLTCGWQILVGRLRQRVPA